MTRYMWYLAHHCSADDVAFLLGQEKTPGRCLMCAYRRGSRCCALGTQTCVQGISEWLQQEAKDEKTGDFCSPE